MTKKVELLELYTGALDALRIRSKDGSLLSMFLNTGEEEVSEIPCTIGTPAKRLTLPTDDVLHANQWDSVTAFHPLCENTLRGESEVIKYLKNTATFNIAFTIVNIVQTLGEIAADPKMQQNLSAKQAKYLKLVSDFDPKVLKVVTKLLDSKFNELISIYLKRDGEIRGKNFRRLVVVDFPIMEEFDTKGSKVYGIECGSAKKKAQIKELFNYVLESETKWDFGSNSDVAPYFHGLMGFYAKFSKHLNALVYKYRKLIPDSEALRVNLDADGWVKYIDDSELMIPLKAVIPSLDGNAGATNKGEEEESSNVDVPDEVKPRGTAVDVNQLLNRNSTIRTDSPQSRQQQRQGQQQPMRQQQPPQHHRQVAQPTNNGAGISLDDMLSGSNQHNRNDYRQQNQPHHRDQYQRQQPQRGRVALYNTSI